MCMCYLRCILILAAIGRARLPRCDQLFRSSHQQGPCLLALPQNRWTFSGFRQVCSITDCFAFLPLWSTSMYDGLIYLLISTHLLPLQKVTSMYDGLIYLLISTHLLPLQKVTLFCWGSTQYKIDQKQCTCYTKYGHWSSTQQLRYDLTKKSAAAAQIAATLKISFPCWCQISLAS